ncbi:MAG: GH92 family glycosyl hydrolase [Verrucomicrobiales bacterium]|nr:GH92 family glycosyl hydrolase [Verrucomicrobiales bacterium]
MHDFSQSVGNSRWVDPFSGNGASALPEPEGIARTWWCAKPPVGNTHPGAVLPFGMVSICAYSGAYVTGYGKYDLSLSGDMPSQLFDRHEALGLAHFQQSGTGRIRSYYNYLLTTPLVGEGLEGLGTRFLLEDEAAEPGYYSGKFAETGVQFETTCSSRSSVQRFHFPENETGKIAIDLSSGGLLIEGMSVYPKKAKVEFLSPSRCEGKVRIEGVTFHFTIEVVTPVKSSGFWKNDGKILSPRSEYSLRKKLRANQGKLGIWFESEAPGQMMELRIGFSTRTKERSQIAVDKLRDTSFDGIRKEATRHWDAVLGKIEIEGATDEQREIFYSALYHSTLKPADFHDENPFTKKDGAFFFDLSTLWDLYKTQLPLLMTLWPELGRDFVEFLTEVAKREGAFPVSYLMNNAPECFGKQATGLCHMILQDAQMRGISGNWEEVLRLLWVTSLGNLGRGGKFQEFAENHVVHPLSHTLDIAFANFCIAQMAKTQGDQPVYDRSIPLADYWRNAFDEKTGLLREDSDYYEGEYWNYSFRFIHDMVGRINLAGGEQAFVELLDLFFGFKEPEDGQIVHRFEGLNNEPDMESPYAYLYAGRHDRTAEVVRNVLRYQFTTGSGGLPGNDDSGGLSSWYVWSAIGVFPVTGLPLMLIGSPYYEKSVIKMRGGDFTVIAKNQAMENCYVQSATLNGRPIDRCFLKIKEFQAGAELVLEMGPKPSNWAKNSRPPSFIS